ncbi:MAG: NAD-dependent epimerase/dehydratase family protein [Alphaproteobacteria bacterium]|nr:NAD-dependent epimerase/dehydratase family protein [Alphaproteobacteria bacterium]
MSSRRICLVGAGFISDVHAEAVRQLRGVELAAVVDTQLGAAQALADRWEIPEAYGTVEEAIESGNVDCAHVLVPPNVHFEIARVLVEAGLPVLIEKPMAASSEECEALVALAGKASVVVGVNQNFVYHPAYRRMRELVGRGALGRLQYVDCSYCVPLRQLKARQFGHWMFDKPQNILLEQAVHPLSQICALAGETNEVSTLAAKPLEVSPGVLLHHSCSVSLECARSQAQLHFAVGGSFPFWQMVAVCDDGAVVADIVANRVFTYERTKWLEFADAYLSGRRAAREISRQSFRNAVDYLLSTLRLKPRSDAFFQSMKGSIEAFHGALDAKAGPELNGEFGAGLVRLCERIAAQAFAPAAEPRETADAKVEGDFEVAVLGGTGFIGTHVVERLLAAGMSVGVMARNVRNLPPVFDDNRVTLVRGDIRRAEDIERGIGSARIVINLAHGGGGASWEEIERSMVESARQVARCCLKKTVSRLIHVGSIAALYLGDSTEVITGKTPTDPKAERRADYARGKAISERLLLDMHEREGLPVTILRPGLVVGEGGIPFHTGVGFYNNEQHCLGWNAGQNPLPFVLVEDVAAAIVTAARKEGVIGGCYNLVGDVRLNAREYVRELGQALGRPLSFHPNGALKLQALEVGKWIVKRLVGRAVPFPSDRDLKSRGLMSRFNCSDVERDLDWRPVSDRETFLRRGLRVHTGPDFR